MEIVCFAIIELELLLLLTLGEDYMHARSPLHVTNTQYLPLFYGHYTGQTAFYLQRLKYFVGAKFYGWYALADGN